MRGSRCLPSRAAFTSGQRLIGTGLATVGMAGSPTGFYRRTPILADLPRPLSHRTGKVCTSLRATVCDFEGFYGNRDPPDTVVKFDLSESPHV